MRRSLNLSKAMSSEILKGREDVFRGITIHSDKINVSKEDAPEILKKSIEEWKTKNVHGIWFKVLNSVSFSFQFFERKNMNLFCRIIFGFHF